MYFAVQSMGAELSTASPCLLAISGAQPSIAIILVNIKGQFYKKAVSKVYFECTEGFKSFEAVEKCKATGEPELVTMSTIGKMADGTVVSEFELTWSLKQRSS